MDNWIDRFVCKWEKGPAFQLVRMPGVILGFISLAVLSFGCQKSSGPSEKPNSVSTPTAPPMETIVRFHWLGKDKIAAETQGKVSDDPKKEENLYSYMN